MFGSHRLGGIPDAMPCSTSTPPTASARPMTMNGAGLGPVYAVGTYYTHADPEHGAATGGDSKFYILRSLVASRLRSEHVLAPERAADRGFEMMVLAMITMNGETMREGAHWVIAQDSSVMIARCDLHSRRAS